MKTLSIVSGILAMMLIGPGAFAQATVQGEVKGVDGRPAQRAQVRLERQDKKSAAVILATDSRGRFLTNSAEEGTYNITAIGAGGVQSPSQSVRTFASRPSMVSFDLRGPQKTANGGKKKKKFIWVPEETGSHMGGHYVEVDEDATVGPSGQNMQKSSSKALEQYRNLTRAPSRGGPGSL